MEIIEGQNYYTVREFADKTFHSVKAIYALITRGNVRGKLPVKALGGRYFIPEEAYTTYVFTMPGKGGSAQGYRFTPSGDRVRA